MAIRLDGANPKAAHVGEVHRGTVESAGHGARVEPFEFERPAWRNLWQKYCFQSGCGSYALGVGFPCFTASREEGNTQMMHPDHHHLIMSLIKYGSLSLAFLFGIRLVSHTLRFLWWESLF